MEEIILSESIENSSFIAYLYNALMPDVIASGGTGELAFGGRRAAFRLCTDETETLHARAAAEIAEIICIGYKYRYMYGRLSVCLSHSEKRLLVAALIAADRKGDCAFVRGRTERASEYSVDGFYRFRLGILREKWERIIRCVPSGFGVRDLKKFFAFLAGESRDKIYVKGSGVYGENFVRLKRSRLTGEEDAKTEIVLSDAGYIYCLGDVDGGVGDFLQKYYAERAIFS